MPPLLNKNAENHNITEIVDLVTRELINTKADLITNVEMGKSPKKSIEAEALNIINRIDEAKYFNRDKLLEAVLNAIFGYDVLEPYLNIPDISDILVNKPDIVFIKRLGELSRIPVSFGDSTRLLSYCRKVAAICGGSLNEDTAEVLLTDKKRNLRIVISIPPVNTCSPSIVIRKPTNSFSLEQLVKSKMLTDELAEYLKDAVAKRKSIIFAGQGGAGKTTLMGACIREVNHCQRGLLIQESNEITINHPNIISQMVRLSDGSIKNYDLFELTKFGLLMSMDRIFIGELKDREAFDFFNAIFTGHRGSMATVHANSAYEILDRLILLMRRADKGLEENYLKELLANSLDVVVFLDNFKIKEIAEVSWDISKKTVKYKTIFKQGE